MKRACQFRLPALAVAAMLLSGRAIAQGNLRVLAVGISSYNHKDQFPALNYAGSDAAQVDDALHKLGYGGTVHKVDQDSGGQETKDAILDALKHMAQDTKPEDTLVFYFAGHGFEGIDKADYLAASDTDDNDPNTALPVVGKGSVEDILEHSQAEHCILIIDACRRPVVRDAGVPLKQSFVSRFQEAFSKPKFAILWACAPGETSIDTAVHFTTKLVEALGGKVLANSAHPLTLGAVFDYVFRHVKDEIKEQTPKLFPENDTTIRNWVIGSRREDVEQIQSVDVVDFSLLPSKTEVVAGDSTKLTIQLDGPAPLPDGVQLTLTSDSGTVAPEQQKVTIQPGQRQGCFAIRANDVGSIQNVQIKAVLSGTPQYVSLAVLPDVSGFNFSLVNSEVKGGESAQARLTLNSPAPSGGWAITISATSEEPALNLPPFTVTVPDGQREKTVEIKTRSVTRLSKMSIKALHRNSSVETELTVKP